MWGPILSAARPAPMMSAIATMPGAWLRDLSQQDGLPMTGCFLADSVKHATHLFLDVVSGWCWCGWPGRGMPVLQARHALSPRVVGGGAPGRFADDAAEHEQ